MPGAFAFISQFSIFDERRRRWPGHRHRAHRARPGAAHRPRWRGLRAGVGGAARGAGATDPEPRHGQPGGAGAHRSTARRRAGHLEPGPGADGQRAGGRRQGQRLPARGPRDRPQGDRRGRHHAPHPPDRAAAAGNARRRAGDGGLGGRYRAGRWSGADRPLGARAGHHDRRHAARDDGAADGHGDHRERDPGSHAGRGQSWAASTAPTCPAPPTS